MTALGDLILHNTSIRGMDRLVLWGWAAQLPEDGDTLTASKETVAEFLFVSLNTVKRRTKSLLKAGWMVDTGERKTWSDGWIPVYRIDVQKCCKFAAEMQQGRSVHVAWTQENHRDSTVSPENQAEQPKLSHSN